MDIKTIKKIILESRMLLIRRFRFNRRQKYRIKEKLRMILTLWKERWEIKRIRNFLHSNKKYRIFLRSNRKYLLHIWLLLNRTLSFLHNKVSLLVKFKGLALWIMMLIHMLKSCRILWRKKWKCILYWLKNWTVLKNALNKKIRLDIRLKIRFIIEL